MELGGRAQSHGLAGSSRPRAVAVDFDGTLTDAGRPTAEVLDALQLTRAAGIRIVLVTGRILTELQAVFPDVGEYFDAIVAENGAVLAEGGRVRCLGPEVDPQLPRALSAYGIPARRGLCIVACSAAAEHLVVDERRRLGLEVQLVHNRNELMVLPSGVNKGTGLRAALDDLRLSAHDTLAVGDAENDHSLLAAAEVGVAVANAVPSLKEEADAVLPDRDGAAVAELLAETCDGRGPWQRAARWFLLLGTDHDAAPVRMPARPGSVLIAGGTGDGKSYLAGLLAEQLIDLGYSLLVLDPEGDHVGLAALPGVVVVGGDLPPPSPATVVSLLERREVSVVVDLSTRSGPERDQYLRDLPAELAVGRRDTGRPHWVFVDEADSALGRSGAAVGGFEPAARGYALITWRPGQLPGETLAAVETVLALTSPRPDDALVDLTAAVAGERTATIAELLAGPVGRVVVARRGVSGTPPVASLPARATAHLRHEHKYSAVGMPTDRRFWFRRDSDHLTGVTAGNLGELEAELAHCERAVLRHHAPRHDLSRWVGEVFHDRLLAGQIRSVEEEIGRDSPAAVVEAGRLALVAVLHARRPGGRSAPAPT